MDQETEKLVEDCEASWPTTKELAFVIDDPLEKLMEKAKLIFKGRHWDNLDALAVRIADACPGGVTEKNFAAAEPIAGAAKKYFSNIEKLRMGLNRPFLDAKKAVDEAAKATVARAEPTLNPIIKAVKAIEDRKKREKEAKEEADRKKIEDERLASEKAHRDMIEAEQKAERDRIANAAEANRLEAERLAAEKKKIADDAAKAEAKNRAVNDELVELKRQMAEMAAPKTVVPTPAPKRDWRPKTPPLFDDEPAPPLVPAERPYGEMILETLEKTLGDVDTGWVDDSPAGVFMARTADTPPSDQQLVRDFGDRIATFKDTLTRPQVVTDAARQAVELAVFDLCEIAKRLQEWRAAT